jgi:hypothetical protein
MLSLKSKMPLYPRVPVPFTPLSSTNLLYVPSAILTLLLIFKYVPSYVNYTFAPMFRLGTYVFLSTSNIVPLYVK